MNKRALLGQDRSAIARFQASYLFRSGIIVPDLPPIQSCNQPEKIEKCTSMLRCHEGSAQLNKDFLVRM